MFIADTALFKNSSEALIVCAIWKNIISPGAYNKSLAFSDVFRAADAAVMTDSHHTDSVQATPLYWVRLS
jgi:hypothetical protein